MKLENTLPYVCMPWLDMFYNIHVQIYINFADNLIIALMKNYKMTSFTLLTFNNRLSQMVKEVGFFSNLLCIILVHPASLPSYARRIDCLLVVGRFPSNKIFGRQYEQNHPGRKTQLKFYFILYTVLKCNNVRNPTNILEVWNVFLSAFINIFNHVSYKIPLKGTIALSISRWI